MNRIARQHLAAASAWTWLLLACGAAGCESPRRGMEQTQVPGQDALAVEYLDAEGRVVGTAALPLDGSGRLELPEDAVTVRIR